MTGETEIVHMLNNAMPSVFSAQTKAQNKCTVGLVDVGGLLHRLYAQVQSRCQGNPVTYGQFIEGLHDQLLVWWQIYPQLHTLVLIMDRQVPLLKNRVRSDRAAARLLPPQSMPQWHRDSSKLDELMPSLVELMYHQTSRQWLYELITQCVLSGMHIDSTLYRTETYRPLLPPGCSLVMDGSVWDNQTDQLGTQTLRLHRRLDGSMLLEPMLDVSSTLYNEADTRVGFWCAHYRQESCMVLATDMDIFLVLLGVRRALYKQSRDLVFVTYHSTLSSVDNKTHMRQVYIDMGRLYYQLDLVARLCWPKRVYQHMSCVDLLTMLVAMCGTDYTTALSGRQFRVSSNGNSLPDTMQALDKHMIQEHPELIEAQRKRLLSQVKPTQKQLECQACPPACKQSSLWLAFWTGMKDPRGIATVRPLQTHLKPWGSDQHVEVLVDSDEVRRWIVQALSIGGKAPKREPNNELMNRLCAQYCYYLSYVYNARLSKYPSPSGLEIDQMSRSSLYGWKMDQQHEHVIPALTGLMQKVASNQSVFKINSAPLYSHL